MYKKKEKPDGCTLYRSAWKTLLLLQDEKAGRVIKAVADYFLNSNEPDSMELDEQLVFTVIREDVDTGFVKFDERCERNKRNRNGTNCDNSSPAVTDGDDSPIELNRTDMNFSEKNRTERSGNDGRNQDSRGDNQEIPGVTYL